jgi:hypothetical protein
MPRSLADLDPDQGGFVSKIRVRYHVEKLCGDRWVLMARVPANTEGVEPLCAALGGKIRVEDVSLRDAEGPTKSYLFEKEFG